jgi:hypothetical protein
MFPDISRDYIAFIFKVYRAQEEQPTVGDR